MTTLEELYDNFIDASKFPVEECIIENTNKNNKGVYDSISDKWYICLVFDKRFKDSYSIRIMKPYIWTDGHNKLFGWVDKNGYYVDNLTSPIHDEDEFIIGFSDFDCDYSLHDKLVDRIIYEE